MALRYLLDENIPARLSRGIQRHNLSGGYPLDVVRVGEPNDLPRSADDPAVLLWAEQNERILVTEDKSTMPGHLAAHLHAGRHSPGILMLRPGTAVAPLIEFLALAAYASQPEEWQDRVP